MTERNRLRAKTPGGKLRSRRVVRLPGFIIDDEIGLGDVVKRVTYAMGVTPCSGCVRRAAALNRWLAFNRRSGRR
jgi:hypothetical protein